MLILEKQPTTIVFFFSKTTVKSVLRINPLDGSRRFAKKDLDVKIIYRVQNNQYFLLSVEMFKISNRQCLSLLPLRTMSLTLELPTHIFAILLEDLEEISEKLLDTYVFLSSKKGELSTITSSFSTWVISPLDLYGVSGLGVVWTLKKSTTQTMFQRILRRT